MSRKHIEQIHEVIREMRTLPIERTENWRACLNQRPEKGLGSNLGTAVNLVVAGAQVGCPTKQPDVLKLPSQSKAN